MPVPDHVVRSWRALDELFARVNPVWWGAVVTDDRYPAIWDANYARIDPGTGGVTALDVERELIPALAAAGTEVMHVVSFDPEASRSLLAELSTRGHRLTFDLVMDLEGTSEVAGRSSAVEELALDEELWDRVEASLALFGVDRAEALVQLRAIERDVMGPAGKRWFGVRDGEGSLVSLGALLMLDDVGYLDNIATFPDARGRGHASSIATAMSDEAEAAGARHVYLLADPDATAVVRLYERVGFRAAGRLAASRGPVPRSDRTPFLGDAPTDERA